MSNHHPRFHAATRPERPALILADTGELLTYAQLVARADRAASLFSEMGIGEGDTVAILLENHIRYPELCWAAKNSGITYACLSSQSSIDDAVYIVDNCDAKLLISSAALATLAVPVAQRLLHCRFLMLDGVAAPFESYEARLEECAVQAPSGRRRGPSMLYSSGTTGRPKGVRSALPAEPPEVPPRRFAMLQDRYGLDVDTVLVSPGPLYHAAPGRFMMSVQRAGGTFIGFRRFEPLHTLRAMQEHGATHGLFVPTMFTRMLELEDAVRRDGTPRALRCALHLGAPCPVSVKEKMIDWWGPVIEEMYGGTEAVGHTMISASEWLAHKGSVGRPASGCSIRIVDDAGRELPPLQPGLVLMRNGHRFEYYKDPDKTRDAIDADGWGTLGDVGYVDADGYLYLTDRQSHMIVVGGVNVYPQEAENVLMEHPAVADVAVIGVPNEQYGEEVKAVVQPREYPVSNTDVLAKDLIAWCLARLSRIKCPRSVEFVEQLPRSEAGKLVKHRVKDPYWAGRPSRIL